MPNALVIDPHPAIRRNALAVLQDESGFDEVRFASGGIEALDALREREADFVMLDLQLEDVPGDAVLEEVVYIYPKTRVLVLSALKHVAERALLSGAHGYVDKGGGMENLGDAVRAVMSGYAAFPLSSLPTIRRAATNPADPRTLLSPRELTVLRFLAVGYSNKVISDVLGISNKTVSSHKTSIMTKLGFNSLIDLLEFSRRHQLAF